MKLYNKHISINSVIKRCEEIERHVRLFRSIYTNAGASIRRVEMCTVRGYQRSRLHRKFNDRISIKNEHI